jgi:hypothetical protein
MSLKVIRQISSYSTDQGDDGDCWAHSRARLISRLIKTLFDSHFEGNEILDEYYDTIRCSSEATIFICISRAQEVHQRKGASRSMHPVLMVPINWENENLSAMLFHFIFNSLKKKYGCNGLEIRKATAPIFYFLKLVRHRITEDKIKDILKYNDYITSVEDYLRFLSEATSKLDALPATATRFAPAKEFWTNQYIERKIKFEQDIVMFSRLITNLASIFESLRISLKNKTLKLNIFTSINLNDFVQVNDTHRFDINLTHTLKPTCYSLRRSCFRSPKYTSISGQSSFFRKHTDWFKRIRQVLEQGLYVLLSIYNHGILITAIEGESFIVKNSWGKIRDWILPNGDTFIVDNKLNISTLIHHLEYYYSTIVILVFIEIARKEDEVFIVKELPNKSFMQTFKKTAKRLSGYFGMGRKIKSKKKIIKN